MTNAALQDNKLQKADRAAHDWYRFVLSFPPHLVRRYLKRFGIDARHTVLDPFCGTGTTLVECKKLGIPSIGVEANPMACLASRVKTEWRVHPEALLEHASRVADAAVSRLEEGGISDELFFNACDEATLKRLAPEQEKLLLSNSISPLPLHKVLVLQDCLRERQNPQFADHETLSLARAIVESASNLHFGPEVGVRKRKDDAAVVGPWLRLMGTMSSDLRLHEDRQDVRSTVIDGDARRLSGLLSPESVDFVFTSPPYPNEKDYTRTTRLESVVLGFIRNKTELRSLKKGLVRSNTRGVYKDDDDDHGIRDHPEIQRLADAIEARRQALGKTSGFERMYARVTQLYFGGMARHLAELRPILKRGAYLAYVVGDQASYLRVLIRTGELLADIADSLGFEVVDVDLFRTRLATATKAQLREEVVLLQWKGRAG